MSDAFEIRSATIEEADATVACIVAAFLTDPIARFAALSPHTHGITMARATHAFGGASFAAGTAFVDSTFCGAALWMPPGFHPDGEELERVFRETAHPAHLDDLLGTFEEMDECHPREPHWYLPLLGVDPHSQGRGLGAALMHHALTQCDAAGLPAYLESSNPRNIPLYLRHGFEVLGEIQVGAGPLVTPMLRPPRGA